MKFNYKKNQDRNEDRKIKQGKFAFIRALYEWLIEDILKTLTRCKRWSVQFPSGSANN